MNDIYSTPIIIVDQDLGFVNELKSLLMSDGFKNILISEPQFVSNLITNKTISYLIIMECNFSGLNNIELLEMIKSNCKNANVIVVSSSKKIVDGFNCLKNGAVSFFRKEEVKQFPGMLLNSIKMSLESNSKQYLLKRQIDDIYKTTMISL